MITRLGIHNFRGFTNLVLEDLKRINLLIGANDTGKTSVLEALLLLLGTVQDTSSLSFAFRANQHGTQSSSGPDDYENFWLWLFHDRNPENELRIVGNTDAGLQVELQSILQSTSPHPGGEKQLVLMRNFSKRGSSVTRQPVVHFQNRTAASYGAEKLDGLRVSRLSTLPSNPTQDAEMYNQVSLQADGEKRIESVMREIEPRLRRLRYAKLPGTSTPLVYADLEGLPRAVPSTQMGQAFNRILHIYAEILSANVNVLLVDEIENGIFSEALPIIWRGLLAICEQQDVQIFATTHSRECVIAAHAVADERGKEDLSVQRLQRVRGEIEAVRLGGKHLELATEMGLEVRS
jgi:hypothetical protein